MFVLLVCLMTCFPVLTQRFSTEPDDFLPRHEDLNGSLEERHSAQNSSLVNAKTLTQLGCASDRKDSQMLLGNIHESNYYEKQFPLSQSCTHTLFFRLRAL